MTTDIAIYENKPLTELYEPLSETQKSYLHFILEGFNAKEALEFTAKITNGLVDAGEIKALKPLESHLLKNYEAYHEQYLKGYQSRINAYARIMIGNLIKMGAELSFNNVGWRQLPRDTQKSIWAAMNVAYKKMGEGGDFRETSEFMEILKRRKITIEETTERR